MKMVNKERLSYGLGIVILILGFIFNNFIVRANITGNIYNTMLDFN